MFGLMRAKKCGMSDAEKHFRRMNYCGTCKTVGSLYGQKARLLLNYDTVFLAEILTALSAENVSDWQKAYQSFNCLSLPQGALPKPLQFAATVNLVLTEFKLADHVADERKRRYRLAQNAFSKEFQTAQKLLHEWNFPLAEIKAILDSQTTREGTEKSLDALAFPTAETTAVFFREGVRQIGRLELENVAFELGFGFGKLVYLVDAFEDYEKDFRGQKFNAFRAAFGLTEEKLSAETKRRITSILGEIESGIIEKIHALPIAEHQKRLFMSRLSQNLRQKLKTNLPVLKAKKGCAPKPKQSFSQRWHSARDKARALTRNYGWQMPLAFLFVFVFALAAPAQTREAKSARECFDLSFNLMFLGAIFGAVLSSPLKMVAINHKRRKKQQQEGGEGSGGDSGDSCCDCDCCCWDCDGCEGCCDGCDCCSGCCDNCGCDGCCDGCDCNCDC
jgi:hypothetical protein